MPLSVLGGRPGTLAEVSSLPAATSETRAEGDEQCVKALPVSVALWVFSFGGGLLHTASLAPSWCLENDHRRQVAETRSLGRDRIARSFERRRGIVSNLRGDVQHHMRFFFPVLTTVVLASSRSPRTSCHPGRCLSSCIVFSSF